MTIRCETCSEEWFPGHTCPQVEQDVEIKPDKNVTLGELREAEDFEAAYVQEEERIKQCIDDFRPHVEDCTCNGCLQSIINKQAEQIEAKDTVIERLKAEVQGLKECLDHRQEQNEFH